VRNGFSPAAVVNDMTVFCFDFAGCLTTVSSARCFRIRTLSGADVVTFRGAAALFFSWFSSEILNPPLAITTVTVSVAAPALSS
jgi:hypothetical protein